MAASSRDAHAALAGAAPLCSEKRSIKNPKRRTCSHSRTRGEGVARGAGVEKRSSPLFALFSLFSISGTRLILEFGTNWYNFLVLNYSSTVQCKAQRLNQVFFLTFKEIGFIRN